MQITLATNFLLTGFGFSITSHLVLPQTFKFCFSLAITCDRLRRRIHNNFAAETSSFNLGLLLTQTGQIWMCFESYDAAPA